MPRVLIPTATIRNIQTHYDEKAGLTTFIRLETKLSPANLTALILLQGTPGPVSLTLESAQLTLSIQASDT